MEETEDRAEVRHHCRPARVDDASPQRENQFERLNRIATESGWRAALEQIFAGTDFDRYIAGSERLAPIEALPLRPGQHILEIGPGYGQMTAAIAARVATVDAIEADAGQAAFCAIRLAQENAKNVRVIAGGQDARLPYADRQFDGVIMNLVLEWCAIRATGSSHDEVQRQYLSEISRVLKPGGFLFLSTKNRYSLRLVTGGRDEHMSGIRFGSALPRILGRMLTRDRRQPGYLHSFPALRGMIEAAGFDEIRPLWAVPDMRWPTAFVPLDPDAIRRARSDKSLLGRADRRTARLMAILPPRLVPYVTPGLTFLARRAG